MSERRCPICKTGGLEPGRTTVTFDDDQGLTIVIRHVPASVCDTCGEAFVDDATARAILKQAPNPQGPAGVLILDYAA